MTLIRFEIYETSRDVFSSISTAIKHPPRTELIASDKLWKKMFYVIVENGSETEIFFVIVHHNNPPRSS